VKLRDHIFSAGFFLCLLWELLWPQQPEPNVVRADFGASLLATLVVAIIVVALTELLRPKPELEDARPAGLGDFQFPTATEGRVIPLIWGTVRLKGPNVVWYGDLEQVAITESIKTGLWDRTRIIVGFEYNVGVQMALCRGPNCVLKQVWIGDDSVFTGTVSNEQTFDIDDLNLFGGAKLGNGGVQATCDFYAGDNPQVVNAYLAGSTDRQLVATAATPTAPRYNGTCYVLARELTSAAATADDRGAYVGNSTTIKPWSFEVQRFPALFNGQSAGDNIVNTNDANPVNVIYEILTNEEWGFGFADGDIDLAAFKTAADTVKTEDNGFSFTLTRAIVGTERISELERQIDGVVQLDVATGLWTIVLARADYDIDLVPQVNENNIKSIRDFTRGTWEETTNVIQVQYFKRLDEYKESYAVAQDMGNALIRGGGTVSSFKPVTAQMSFPGVKNEALAVNLAWRELRQKTYPLARVSLVLTREFWDLKIGEVIAWTDSNLGFTKLPLRIAKVDLGRLDKNEVKVECIQDVFTFQAASFGDPVATGWTDPVVDLVAFPSDEQLVIEAPRALVVKDPDFAGDDSVAKVFCAARRQGSELGFNITQRNSSGTPAGAYTQAGDGVSFMRIGQLANNLASGTAIPTAEIPLVGTPDSVNTMNAVFDAGLTPQDLGQDLAQLIYGNGEFMLVTSAAIDGINLDLQNVYRGVLDSYQKAHTSGTDVYLVFAGASVSDTAFPQGNNVDIELRPFSADGAFVGSVTTVALTMSNRIIRPYPPAAVTFDGIAYGDMDVETDGAGLNDRSIDMAWLRRRYDNPDEVAAKLADDTTVDASTEYRVRFYFDSTELSGSPVDWAAGTPVPITINREELISIADIDSTFRVEIQTRHDVDAETDLEAQDTLVHEVVPTSIFNGLFYLGAAETTLPNAYTALATGTYTVTIGAAYSAADVEYRLNGGSWTTAIAAGGTTGNITGVTATDTIEIRSSIPDIPTGQIVELRNPSATLVAYGDITSTAALALDPSSISDLTAWWDPDDSATVTLSSGDVVQLDDKVGSLDLEDALSNPPEQVSVNGRNWMSFDGVNEAMFNDAGYADSAINMGSGELSMFLVFRTGSSTTNLRAMQKGSGSGRYAMDINRASAGDARAFVTDGSINREATGAASANDDNAHVFYMERDNTANLVRLYIDGVLIDTDGISTLGSLDDTTDADFFSQLLVGAAPLTASTLTGHFDGEIGEILIYKRLLSGTERGQVEDYLEAKWGV